MRRGCTVSSSLPNGQGAEADQQVRFMYEARRDEMMAHGFADCCTDVSDWVRTVASSLIRCGRLPVDCSWTTTASTMSSLMLSRSISFVASASVISSLMARVGDGGGVFSMAMESAAWDLLSRLLGGASGDSEREALVDAGVAEAEDEAAREALFDEAAREACVTGM